MIEKNENKKTVLGDKILGAHNNPYNEKNYDENFNIDETSSLFDASYNEEAYLHNKKLEELIHETFKNSRWFSLTIKKIPKDLIAHIFSEILENINDSEFSFIEKFVGICDYLGLKYNRVYESVTIKHRELIVQELDKKFKILSKRGMGKLF